MEFIAYIKCDCGDERGFSLDEFKNVLSSEYNREAETTCVDLAYSCTNCGRLISFPSLWKFADMKGDHY